MDVSLGSWGMSSGTPLNDAVRVSNYSLHYVGHISEIPRPHDCSFHVLVIEITLAKKIMYIFRSGQSVEMTYLLNYSTIHQMFTHRPSQKKTDSPKMVSFELYGFFLSRFLIELYQKCEHLVERTLRPHPIPHDNRIAATGD
jgi:hypothetical protein